MHNVKKKRNQWNYRSIIFTNNFLDFLNTGILNNVYSHLKLLKYVIIYISEYHSDMKLKQSNFYKELLCFTIAYYIDLWKVVSGRIFNLVCTLECRKKIPSPFQNNLIHCKKKDHEHMLLK